ncbi:uncharacterized protein METZ01_LOCUS17372 [marine metagenome]|uniref:Uncharacterized protein n=1 Tax=marine metagenome TaxID=408172 RepID=A0A381PDY6_9ZZZZ
MSILLFAIVNAGPLGPSPRTFAGGVALFIIGWVLLRPTMHK